MHVYLSEYAFASVYLHEYRKVHIYAHIYIYIYMFIYIYIYVHIYTEHSFLIRAVGVPAAAFMRLLVSNSRPELEMTRIRNDWD